jgi:long-chain acyl-CoA synthetase
MGTHTRDQVTAPQTVAALLGQTIRRHPERPALRFTDAGADRSLTWLEVGLLVVEAGRWLVDLGRPSPVTIVAPPSPASWVLELAGLIAGCSINVVYDDAPADELERALGIVMPGLLAVDATTGARVSVAATRGGHGAPIVGIDELFASWSEGARTETRRHGVSGFEAASVIDALGVLSLNGEQRHAPALLLQSTGTTGPAKVIELPSRSLLAATWALRSAVAHRHPRFLALLPSGHISHQLIDLLVATLLAGEVVFGGGIATVVPDLRSTRPTVLFGSPLIYREVKAEVRRSLASSGLGRWLSRRIDAATQLYLERGVIERGTAPLAGRLVGRKVARSLGLDRAQDLFSGTSPLDAETHAFFAALGWFVRNTYGLSECGGAATISRRDRMVVAELGEPVEGTELCRSADGQLLLRGPSQMTGFLGGPRLATDGWLATGDLVAWTANNSLTFVGRRSTQVQAPGGPTTLDALEAAVEAAHPGTQAVVDHDEDGLTLLVFPAPCPDDLQASAGASAVTPAALARFVRSRAVADGFQLVHALGVGTSPLAAERGEIGPTGKVRRWRVGANWSHVLAPADRSSVDPRAEFANAR